MPTYWTTDYYGKPVRLSVGTVYRHYTGVDVEVQSIDADGTMEIESVDTFDAETVEDLSATIKRNPHNTISQRFVERG